MELGDEGNSGKDKVGVQKFPKNTGPKEMTCHGTGRVVFSAKATAHLKPLQMYIHPSKARDAGKAPRTACPFLRNTLWGKMQGKGILTVLRTPLEHSWDQRMVYHPGASHHTEEWEILRKWC